MAAASTTAKAKAAAATPEEVVDEVWKKLQTENHIPNLVFGPLSLPEPTKRQIDVWRTAETIEAGERALFGDLYDKVHEVFGDLPQHVWENFNVLYLKHMFGTAGEDELKG